MTLEEYGRKIAVATDTGMVTDTIRDALTGADFVMLESNHDIRMLENGPYPYHLKRRVLSNHGHLSNAACADTITSLVENGTTRLVLGHLSKQNNFRGGKLNLVTALCPRCRGSARLQNAEACEFDKLTYGVFNNKRVTGRRGRPRYCIFGCSLTPHLKASHPSSPVRILMTFSTS